MPIEQRIADELGVRERQVQAAVELLDGGATVPFVARYRKEAIGALDDTQLRALQERLHYLRELAERRAAVLEAIRAQGKLDAAVEARVMAADSKARLEDVYLPYRPKRRTRAQLAREAGLEPAGRPTAGRPGPGPAGGRHRLRAPGPRRARRPGGAGRARAILVERLAEDADLVGALREQLWSRGRLVSRVRAGKQEVGAKFADYFDVAEPLDRLPSHRILAMFRGEKEEVLDLAVQPESTSDGASG